MATILTISNPNKDLNPCFLIGRESERGDEERRQSKWRREGG